ncbi:WXG100 family type VII secretion target [Bacillus cereus]|uniref:WXG100 family type VII secretion target n=1 Tax=Bacillus cereus TaxID=1396 RepID=UPI00356F7A7D
MVQIKVTPEMLEEVAKRAYSTRHTLESIHKNLCNQIDHLCYQWMGASSQHFVQMFNDAKPKAFTSINAISNVEEELKRIAEKFRTADASYDGNLVDGKISDDNIEEGAMCGPLSNASDAVKQENPKEKSTFEKIVDGGWSGAGEAVGDTIDGFKSLGDAETWENLGNSLLHPIDTLKGMGQAISESWNKDVVNGDAESRTKFFTYGLTQLALGVLGDKGVSKVVKVAKGVKMSQGMTELPQLFNKGDNLAFAGGGNIRSGFDTPDFRQAEEKLSTHQFARGEGGSGGDNPVDENHTPPLSNREIISSLQETENYRPRALKHILEGEINSRGEAVGYHTEILENTAGKTIPGTERRINDYGAYKAQVEVNGIPKGANGGYSTFFPKDWHPQRIIDNINEAYNNKTHMGGNTNIYEGTGIDGLPIRLFIDSNGKIISAFPRR